MNQIRFPFSVEAVDASKNREGRQVGGFGSNLQVLVWLDFFASSIFSVSAILGDEVFGGPCRACRNE